MPKKAAQPRPRKPVAERKDEPAKKPDSLAAAQWPIVGIGASAGGFEALKVMLHVLPADTGMAFVFIQHLDPRHESLLTELLARETPMRVREVTDGMRAEPNQLHVIPRNTSMQVKDGVLNLIPRPPGAAHHMPVDHFFRSLAEDQHARAIGVVLSGTASDGAIGLKAIKAEGGITFAQEESSAKYDGMPRSAIAAGGVDFILPPADIAKELMRIGKHPYVLTSQPADENELAPEAADGFKRILAALRFSSGVDFTYYKATTVRRRILRRMNLHRLETIDKYAAFLKGNAEELRSLYEDILINVTEFFRDVETFAMLKEKIFPGIIENRGDAPVRIWVPGCSTGEEVYSIAICLLEALEERKNPVSLQIFGTDLSDEALEKARAGIYPPGIAQSVSADRLRRFFVKMDGGYQIAKRIREVCVFARQNLTRDPPFSRLDLISCRNLLIYLGPVLQKKVMPVLHYALKPAGYLLLGSSETIGGFADLFEAVDKKNKLYTRRPVAAPLPIDFAVPDLRLALVESSSGPAAASDPHVQKEADRVVMSKYGPPGVVVDELLNIIQFRGQTGAFLEPASGAASLNVLKMAREGLMVELRNAVQRSRKDQAIVRREGLLVQTEGGPRPFNLEVVPLYGKSPAKDRHTLILFERAAEVPGSSPARGRKKATVLDKGREGELQQLRTDLRSTKEYLQSIIEEQEATNEELRSANEEIQSSNEELQSTNEEMETAKEELQSTNEELNTVNEELQTRNLQLAQAGNDLVNLLSNVSIPIIMLGNDLRIRRFTPVCEKMLNLIPSDVGRPVTDIRFPLEIPNLEQLVLDVISHLAPKSVEVRDGGGRIFSLRVRPYRTEDNRIEGVVIVLVDLDPPRSPEADVDLIETARAAQMLGSQEMAAAHRREQLQALAGQLFSAQEEESRRIARELHDDLGQRLASMEIRMRDLANDPDPQKLRNGVQSLQPEISQLMTDMTIMAYRLHPSKVDDLGLVAVLRSHVQEFEKQHHIHVRFTASAMPKSVSGTVAISLFRIAQEALRNVARHSGATKATVTLFATPQAVRLTVRDFGRGLEGDETTLRPGLGLTSMEERARLVNGVFAIKSDRTGTQVDVHVPLSDGKK